jgi:hypothetical protein
MLLITCQEQILLSNFLLSNFPSIYFTSNTYFSIMLLRMMLITRQEQILLSNFPQFYFILLIH